MSSVLLNVCVCMVYMCVHAYADMCAGGMYIHGGPTSMLSVFFNHSALYFLRQSLSEMRSPWFG